MDSIVNSLDYIGKRVAMVVDRPLGSVHPKHANIIYNINYGYIPNTQSGDGEELDAYLIGVDKPLDKFEGFCIAVLRRTQENDDKLIIVPEGTTVTEQEIRKQVDFQEKFFESNILWKSL